MSILLACLLLGGLTNAAAAYFAAMNHNLEASLGFIALLIVYVVLSAAIILGANDA